MRTSGPVAVLLSIAFFTVVLGQIPGGNQNLYLSGITANGIGRVGDGFYVPPGCSYVIDYYGQCGGNGTNCNPASGVCADAQFPGACCPSGFTCSRQSAQYWQCVEQVTYSNPLLIPLQPYAQCGGSVPVGSNITLDSNGNFAGTECPNGYSCLPQSNTSSICAPNPFASANEQYRSPTMDIASEIFTATGADTLAPGLAQYDFDVPGKTASPPKPVQLVVNTTLIGDFLDDLLNKNATSPPPPGASPPGTTGTTPATPPGSTPYATAPSPAFAPAVLPTPSFNFTVPQITFQPPPAVSIAGTNLVTSNGTVVQLHGLNWFGFEVGSTMVQGLTPNYADPHNISQTGDFATVVYRQQALGFNIVRLPFTFSDLNAAAQSITQPCSVDTLAEIEGNLTNPTAPYYQIPYGTTPFPAQRSPPANGVQATGICNSDVPADTTLNRYLYVIQYYIGNGFYVTIDYHAGLGGIETDRQTVSNATIFEENWLTLLTALQSLPTYQANIKGRIFFDLLNEPDGFNMTWSYPNINTRGQFANSSTVPAWGSLFTNTASLLVQQEPSLLLLAEGTGQYNQPGTAYGQGFGINPAIYTNAAGLSNALLGLQTLVGNAAVQSRTLISPHVYGEQVTGWFIGNTDNTGLGLPYTYYNNWAYLSEVGVPPANGGPNATFPILIGEFGNVFNSSLNATTDQFSDQLTNQWIHDFAQFNNNLDPVNATAYPHAKIVNTMWWAWNGNQAQALGFVNADPGNVAGTYNGALSPGWLHIQWLKIDNVTNVLTGNPYYTPTDAIASGGGFGLRPWYLPGSTAGK